MMTRREFGIVSAAAAGTLTAADKEQLVYIGTYTRGGSKGIYVYRFNPTTGKLAEVGLAAETQNPSFLYVSSNGKRLYSVGEDKQGSVSAFDVDRSSGKLTKLNEQPTGGDGPCHLTANKAEPQPHRGPLRIGQRRGVALKEDGSLGERTAFVQHKGSGPNTRRQDNAHAHSVNLSKNEQFAVVADLGMDEFLVYKFDAAKGSLTQHSTAKVKPRIGSAAFFLSPGFKYAYGVNKLRQCQRIRLERIGGIVEGDSDDFYAACRLPGIEQLRRDSGSSVGEICVRLKPGAQQHRCFLGRQRMASLLRSELHRPKARPRETSGSILPAHGLSRPIRIRGTSCISDR